MSTNVITGYFSIGGTKQFFPHYTRQPPTQSATPSISVEVSNLIDELSPIHTRLILASQQGKPMTDEELQHIRNQIKSIQKKYRPLIDNRILSNYIRYTYDLYPSLKPERQSMPFGEPLSVSPKRRKINGGYRKRTYKRTRTRTRTQTRKNTRSAVV